MIYCNTVFKSMNNNLLIFRHAYYNTRNFHYFHTIAENRITVLIMRSYRM